jgi:hypothetical protein
VDIVFDAWRKLLTMDPLSEILPGIQARDLCDALDTVTDMLDGGHP